MQTLPSRFCLPVLKLWEMLIAYCLRLELCVFFEIARGLAACPREAFGFRPCSHVICVHPRRLLRLLGSRRGPAPGLYALYLQG
jgi:hypothetical protein